MKISEITKLFQKYNFVASKKLGQNFLINDDICNKIINTIENIDNIVEIGMGFGALTNLLITKAKKYTGIEIDKRLYDYIKTTYSKTNTNFINNDCLNVKYNLLKPKNFSLISNLPYSISSLMIVKFIKEITNANTFYIMLQKEMYERINAKISTKDYNNFSCLVQHYASIKKLFDINRNNFYPVPNVDSVFLCIKKNNKKYDKEYDEFLKLCFCQRRKTIINNLKQKYNSSLLKNIFSKLGINENTRAEELNNEKIFYLYNQIKNGKNS